MPRGVYIKKENVIYGNSGKKASSDLIKKLSDSHKGQKAWNKGLKTGKNNEHSKRMKNRKVSIETRKKTSEAMKGDKCYLWKGGINEINNSIRKCIEYRLWRESVFARDGWTCQKTGVKGGKIVAHHILNFASNPKLRFAIDNGITLSEKAHKIFHIKYGIKNNTRKQLIEFLNNINKL